MFNLLHNSFHLTCCQSNAQNSASEASIVCEPKTSRCSRQIQKRQRNQRSNYQHLVKNRESKRVPEITSALLTTPKPLTVWIPTNWKILQEMGIPDHLTCLLRNLYAGQEATVRNGHASKDWFQLEKKCVKDVYSHPTYLTYRQSSIEFSSVAQSCPIL